MSTFSFFFYFSILFYFLLYLDANMSFRLHSFSKVVSRLFELGVPTQQFVAPEPWIMPTVDEQKTAVSAKKD